MSVCDGAFIAEDIRYVYSRVCRFDAGMELVHRGIALASSLFVEA